MDQLKETLYRIYFACLTPEEFDRLIPDSMVLHLLGELNKLEHPVGKPRKMVMLVRY